LPLKFVHFGLECRPIPLSADSSPSRLCISHRNRKLQICKSYSIGLVKRTGAAAYSRTLSQVKRVVQRLSRSVLIPIATERRQRSGRETAEWSNL